jgi:2-polyprenyl-6-hydroxyphenyl methylase/3-demethylubiquinone-9 3-methyltransferase
VDGPVGVVFSPLSGRWSQSSDTDVNYMMTVKRPGVDPAAGAGSSRT